LPALSVAEEWKPNPPVDEKQELPDLDQRSEHLYAYMKLALDHGVTISSADDRLLPMLNGVADQLEDLEDFWQWYRGSSPAVLQREAL
jgi:hypothetical protein